MNTVFCLEQVPKWDMVFRRVEDLLWIFSDMTHQKVSKISKICVKRLIVQRIMQINGCPMTSRIKT